MQALLVLFQAVLIASTLATPSGGARSALIRRQDISACDDLCSADQIASCTTNECFCTSTYLDAFHACLQCEINNNESTVDELPSFQADLDAVIKGCRNLGTTVPDEPLTERGGGTGSGASLPTSTASSASTTASSPATTSSPASSSSTSTAAPGATSSTSAKSGASNVQGGYFVAGIAALGVLYTSQFF